MSREWYTVFDDDVGRLKLEFTHGRVCVHYKAFAGPVRAALRVLRIRESVENILRAIGYRSALAYFKENAKLERLCVMLGFTRVRSRNGWVLMEVAIRA